MMLKEKSNTPLFFYFDKICSFVLQPEGKCNIGMVIMPESQITNLQTIIKNVNNSVSSYALNLQSLMSQELLYLNLILLGKVF